MSGFDYVFEGPPTLGIPYGPALGVDITTGVLYVSQPQKGQWVATGGGSFTTITSGTNSAASLVIGSGASLSTSGTGTITATPAGSDTQIQYNKAGAFTADANLEWLYSTGELFINNTLALGGSGPALAIGTPLANPLAPGGLMLTGGSVSGSATIEIHNIFANGIALFTHSNTGFRAPSTGYYRSHGTQTSPTAVVNTDILAYPNQVFAYDGSVYGSACTLEARATENWNTTSHGCAWDFFVVANTTTNQFRAMQVDNTGFVGIGLNSIGPPARLSVGPTSQFQVADTGNISTSGNLSLTSNAAATVSSGQVSLGATTSASASAGATQAVPATVLGYLVANVGGTTVKIPYFSA